MIIYIKPSIDCLSRSLFSWVILPTSFKLVKIGSGDFVYPFNEGEIKV